MRRGTAKNKNIAPKTAAKITNVVGTAESFRLVKAFTTFI